MCVKLGFFRIECSASVTIKYCLLLEERTTFFCKYELSAACASCCVCNMHQQAQSKAKEVARTLAENSSPQKSAHLFGASGLILSFLQIIFSSHQNHSVPFTGGPACAILELGS